MGSDRHRPVISENGQLQRSPENAIQKSISSVRNVRDRNPIAPLEMSGLMNSLTTKLPIKIVGCLPWGFKDLIEDIYVIENMDTNGEVFEGV